MTDNGQSARDAETTARISQRLVRTLLADNAALLFALRTLASTDIEMKDARRVARDILMKIDGEKVLSDD